MSRLNIVFLVVFLLFSSCISQPQQNQTVAEQKEQSAPQTAEEKPAQTQGPVVVTKCEDTDGQNIEVKGKAILYYSDGTKESLGDYCLREDPAFEIEYFCDGLEAKTKINKCDDSCEKGVCI